MFLSDADDSLLLITGAWEVFRGAFVPLLTACTAAIVALYAIHRTDLRERTKRRRDEILKAGLDFDSAVDEMNILILHCFYKLARADKPTEYYLQFASNVTAAMGRLGAVATRLSLMGEMTLSAQVDDFHSNADKLRHEFVDLVDAKTISTESDPDRGRPLFLGIQGRFLKAAGEVIDSFREEVQRLDRPADGWVGRMLNRFERP